MTTPTPPLPAVVDLTWEEPPSSWYVRGHHPEALAVAAVRAELEYQAEEGPEDTEIPEIGAARHLYARWGIGETEDGARTGRFHCPVDKRPGAFPVTEIRDLGELERHRRARADQAAHALELEDRIRAWLPEATELRAHGYPVGQGLIRFRLPGLVGELTYRAEDPRHVTIQEQDRQAWETLYRGRPTAPSTTTPRPRP
jgi:hypothetical protein